MFLSDHTGHAIKISVPRSSILEWQAHPSVANLDLAIWEIKAYSLLGGTWLHITFNSAIPWFVSLLCPIVIGNAVPLSTILLLWPSIYGCMSCRRMG